MKKTAREILEKLYRQGSFEGEHTELHPDRVASALSDLSELVMGEKKDITGFTLGNGKDSEEHIRCAVQNYTCEHIAKLFATDKEEKYDK